MGKPTRSSTLTERSADTDSVDASKVGSHDPLVMTVTANSATTINDYVLAYIVGHIHQRPREQIKTVVLSHFTKCEILAAKHALWDAYKPVDVLDKMIHRVDTTSRSSEDANTDDIVTALMKIYALNCPPCVVLNAQDIVRLPKYSPGELLEPSLVERLAVLESQLRQLSDSVSTNTEKRLRMEGDISTLAKKAASTPSRSYAETLKTSTDKQQKKLTVKLTPASTDQSGKHRKKKVASGTVKRTSRQAPRVASESRTVGSTTVVDSAALVVNDVDTQGRIDVNSSAGDSFEIPSYLRRKNERRMAKKTVTGTATASETLMAARNGQSVRDIFVSRVSKEVKPDDLKSYVESKGFTVLNVKCVSHNEAKNSSFKLTVPFTECDKLFDSGVWPEGISIRIFRSKYARNTF